MQERKDKDEDKEPRVDAKDTEANTKDTGDQNSKKGRFRLNAKIDVLNDTGSGISSSAGSDMEDKSKRALIISWEDRFEVLQNIYYASSHVAKVKAKYVKTHLLENIDDEDDVVVKIFDPTVARIRKSSRSEITEYVNKAYECEKNSAQRIVNIKVDTLYLKQVYGSAIFNFGFGRLIRGKFILSRYVESSDLPKTKESYDMLQKQLDIIHDAGIIHGDISEENILFDKERNKAYIIDFATPEGYSFDYNKEGDIHSLQSLFYEAGNYSKMPWQ